MVSSSGKHILAKTKERNHLFDQNKHGYQKMVWEPTIPEVSAVVLHQLFCPCPALFVWLSSIAFEQNSGSWDIL